MPQLELNFTPVDIIEKKSNILVCSQLMKTSMKWYAYLYLVYEILHPSIYYNNDYFYIFILIFILGHNDFK